MTKKKTITKTDKFLGIVAREMAGVVDSVRLPKTTKPQTIARKLYKTAHTLTGVPQKRLVKRDEEETL